VHQSVVLLNGSPIIQTPKTAASRRTVQLSTDVVAALRKHRLAQTERRLASPQWADSDLVFCTRDGKPLNPNNVYRNYQAIIDLAGITRINLHGARHTHTTLALASGAPLKAVSERLGHAKSSVTLDIYSHVLPDMQDRVVEAIDAALFRDL
jgi:integrase